MCSHFDEIRHQGSLGISEEPVFNHNRSSDFPQILQEWLENLASQNAKDIKQANSNQCLFKQGTAANFVFLVCDKLMQPYQVKFAALELFDRFMKRHLEDLYDHVYTNVGQSSDKNSQWKSIQDRIKKQQILRIVSCCQIASKLNSHHQVVTVARAKKFLLEAGHNYTTDSILMSELRILKTLDFHVSVPSPLDYMEILLQILVYNASCLDLPVSVYQPVACKILCVLYLRCDQIFKSVLNTDAHLSSREKLREKLIKMQADKIFIGSAVVAATAYICDQHHTDKVIEHLHRITQVPRKDLEDFVIAVVRQVQNT